MLIGIIGGGQLGMYLAKYAQKLNHNALVLEPNINCSASKYATIINKNYEDIEGLNELLACDVITYEFENINYKAIDYLISKGGNVVQQSKPLKISQHRFIEKEAISKANLKTAEYHLIKKLSDLENIQYPYLIKTCTNGYDGKGQFKINNKSDLEKFRQEYRNDIEYITESLIYFEFEMSLILIRNKDNTIKYFDPIINQHVNGILHISKSSDERINEQLKKEIIKAGKTLIESLDIYGILAIEMFYGKDQQIYINEIAPRPHNSGHLTMDAYNVSQYEALIRMLTNQNDYEIKLIKEVVMVNILGQDIEKIKKLESHHKLYWYFKEEPKNNRKMGHINLIDNNIKELEKEAKTLVERG